MPVPRLYTTDARLRGWSLVNPDEMSAALHPYVLSNGRVIYTSWKTNHNQPYRFNNGNPGRQVTRNVFWVLSVDSFGGSQSAMLAGHSNVGGTHPLTSDAVAQLTPHFLGERSNGDWCTALYYTQNNMGGGAVQCHTPEAPGIEGLSPGLGTLDQLSNPHLAFVPSNTYRVDGRRTDILLTARSNRSNRHWGTTRDSESLWSDIHSVYLGKLRDPHGIPDEQLLLTYLDGPCGIVSIGGYGGIELTTTRTEFRAIEAAEATEQPGCNAGIYRTTVIPSINPPAVAYSQADPADQTSSDMVAVVDSPVWHEFMAVPVEPYSWTYGVSRPQTSSLRTSPNAGQCIWASSNVNAAETSSIWPHGVQTRQQCANQGCEMELEAQTQIDAIRFFEAIPNTDANTDGNRGWAAMQSLAGFQQRWMGDAVPQADGSIAVEVPCDAPFTIAGVGSDGHVIKRDQMVQSLRPGEMRLCSGCHLHSAAGHDLHGEPLGGAGFDTSLAADVLANAPTDLTDRASWQAFDWTADIQPILVSRCGSCHSGAAPAGTFHVDVVQSSASATRAMEDEMRGRPEFARPRDGRGEPEDVLDERSTELLTGELSSYYCIAWDFNQQCRVTATEDRRIVTRSGSKAYQFDRPMTTYCTNVNFPLESPLLWYASGERLDRRSNAEHGNDIDYLAPTTGEADPHAPASTGITVGELDTIARWLELGAFRCDPDHAQELCR